MSPFQRGVHVSTKTGKEERYDSSYERRRFEALDASPLVLTWTREHGIRIPYTRGRRRHHYLPDILVEMVDGRCYLEEVKGYVRDPIGLAHKNFIACAYCLSRGLIFRLVRRDDLETVA